MNQTLDSRQLSAFVVLAGNGSYTETAKQLFVTHSAISHSMRALEEQVGCRLLSKLNKKVVLTEAGEALLPYAHRVLEEMQEARRTLIELNKWGSRRLRLVASTEVLSCLLPLVLLKFHQEFPNLVLQVESCGAGEPETWLHSNQADVALAEKPATEEAVEFIPLLADRFHLVASPDHPLAAMKHVPRKELGAHPSFLPRLSNRKRKQLEDFLSRRDIPLSLAGEMDSLDAIKSLVQHTRAMSFLPGWCIATELKNQSLCSLPLGRTRYEQTWGLMHPRNRPLNHAESTLLKLCRKRVSEDNSFDGRGA